MTLPKNCMFASCRLLKRHSTGHLCKRWFSIGTPAVSGHIYLCRRWFSSVTPAVSGHVSNLSTQYTLPRLSRYSSRYGVLTNHLMPQRCTSANQLSVKYLVTRISRTGEIGENPEKLSRQLSILGDADTYLSAEQWYEVRRKYFETMLNTKSEFSFHRHVLCDIVNLEYFEMGQSLFDWHMAENLLIRDGDICFFLKVCLLKDKVDHIFRWYASWLENKQRVSYPILLQLIPAYCQTEMWRESLPLLRQVEAIESPSTSTYGYIISAACRFEDWTVMGDLLDRMSEKGVHVTEAFIMQMMRASMQRGNATDDEKKFCGRCDKLLGDMLDEHRRNRTYPSIDLVKEMQAWFKSKDEIWETNLTTVHPKGHCLACKMKLNPLDISQQQFDTLREQVMEKVVKGDNIFRKTSPEELETFIQYIDEGAPYDVIIDGLNVAMNQVEMSRRAQRLHQFVVFLVEKCGYKCLLLGRQHMTKNTRQWNNYYMQDIRDMADCFFTENLSKDDPFLLYAALHSGPRTRYVTRDMLRDHKALMDDDMESIFFRWQRSRQLYPVTVKPNGTVIFTRINNADVVVQNTEDSWHIPYDDGSKRYSYQVPNKWLCAKKITASIEDHVNRTV